MDWSKGTVNNLTEHDSYFLENVMIDIRGYINLLNNSNKKIVLLFPPVNNFRRFLIHQLVEKTYCKKNLTTLSVGSLYARRTVVFPSKFKLMMEKKNNFVGLKNDAEVNDDGKKKTKISSVAIYRPPAARNNYRKTNSSRLSNTIKRSRKPDIQIYVPRARRLMNSENVEECQREDEPCKNFESQYLSDKLYDNIQIEKSKSSVQKKMKDDVNNTSVNSSIDNDLTLECLSDSFNHINTSSGCEIVFDSSLSDSVFLPEEFYIEENANISRNNSIISQSRNKKLSEDSVVINDRDMQNEVKSDLDRSSKEIECNEWNDYSSSNISEDDFIEFNQVFENGSSVENSTKAVLEQNDNISKISNNDSSIFTPVFDFIGFSSIPKNDSFTENHTVSSPKQNYNYLNVSSRFTPVLKNNISIENSTDSSLDEQNDNTPKVSDTDLTGCTPIFKSDSFIENSTKFPHKQNKNTANVSEDDFIGFAPISKNCSSANNSEKSVQKPKITTLNVNECDWEELYDDNGEYVNKCLIDELMSAVGKVSIHRASQDYRPFQATEERSSDGECIIEVYGFPSDFTSDNLSTVFASYRFDSAFQIIWVDDTHALAVFSNPLIANEVLNTELPHVKTRPLKNANAKSKMKASNVIVQPSSRPKTCASLARRLVSGHLGMKINVTPKQREAEKKLLSDARERKRLVAKQKLDMWDGASSSGRT